ncbi:MAG: AraC family transcriptional regulator [Vicinamibacteraceae bacterium]
MLNSELPRPTRGAQLLLRLGTESGLTAEQCLHETGLTESLLADPVAEISAGQELALACNLVAALEPGIGLEAGARCTIEMFGMFGFACMSAPTLRETIELALRYQDLGFTLAEARLAAEDDLSFIEADTSRLPDEARRFAADHCVATAWAALRDITDKIEVAAIELDYEQPDDVERYRRMFGKTPRFGQPTARIGFHNRTLDRPRELVDSEAMLSCERECAELLARRAALVGTSGLVRDRLMRATGPIPSMRTVASDLYMSARTLRRRLELEGTSFREITVEVRQQRADALLTEGLSVGEVAYRLGYATSSAFVHAYKRWHGVTPGSSAQPQAQSR